MLEQPETKQAIVQRKYSIGCQQGKFEDVRAAVDKFFQFSCTMVSFDMNNLDSYLFILLHMSEFAELIYENYFKNIRNKNLAMIPWLPHTLLTYL